MKRQQSQKRSSSRKSSGSERGSMSRSDSRLGRSKETSSQRGGIRRAGEGGREQNAGGPEHEGLSADIDKNP